MLRIHDALAVQCGCVVRVNQPDNPVPPKRVIASHGSRCQSLRHQVGVRVYLWDMLPGRIDRSQLLRAELNDDAQWTA